MHLITRVGPLDLLASIGDGLTYEDLLPQSRDIFITEMVHIKVLKLDAIIAIQEKLGSEKDAAMLPLLRQTARESRNREP